MSMPYVASVEQIVRDKAELARKGIARGRSVVVGQYADGILFVAENASRTLSKVSEIYDRIGFAAVGKYNEFEYLRIEGIRNADIKGYRYDRSDVTCREVALNYAHLLGAAFTSMESKPFEVELVLAEVGKTDADDRLFRISFDGSLTDEPDFIVAGSAIEQLTAALTGKWDPQAPLPMALQSAVAALRAAGDPNWPASALEVAVLERARTPRSFRRIENVAELIG